MESSFWEDFRKEVKSEFPDTVLIGETWGDAGKLVQGNQMDAAMNYLFKDAVTDWIAKEKIDTSCFDTRINFILSRYSDPTLHRMYNPLDSHDTGRFLFDCGGKVEKLRLAAALMLTFPGCPAIYYGDEIGMSGGNDPGSRAAMEWAPAKQDRSLREWYKKLISIRKSSPVFSRGSFSSILCDSETGVYGYLRSDGNQNAYVVLNRSPAIREVYVPVKEKDSEFTELITGETVCSDREAPTPLYNSDISECKGAVFTLLPAYSVKIFMTKESGECL